MLTESEREWIRENKTRNGCIYARRCRYTCFEPPYCPVIPTKEDLIDAATFEGRVAAKLATDENCGVDEDLPPDKSFGWGRLKAARLAVEEEMDAD